MPNTVITGPAIITWNSVTWFSAGDIIITMSRELTHIAASHLGRVDSRHKQQVITIQFTPLGQVTEIIGALGYLSAKKPGQSLVPGGTGLEKALIIKPVYDNGGRVWTFLRAGLTGVADFNVSATKTQMGQFTFTALESQVTAATYFTTAAWSAFPSEAETFNATSIYTSPCKAVWAVDPDTLASGDIIILSTDGWTIGHNVGTLEHYREAVGIADITLTDITCTVTGTAANVMDYQSALLAEQSQPAIQPFMTTLPGQRAARKQLRLVTLQDDDSNGSGVLGAAATLWSFGAAELDMQTLAWGAGVNRTGNVRFTIIPTFTSGVRSLYDAGAQD